MEEDRTSRSRVHHAISPAHTRENSFSPERPFDSTLDEEEGDIPELSAVISQQIHKALSRTGESARPRLPRSLSVTLTIEPTINEERHGDTDYRSLIADRVRETVEEAERREREERPWPHAGSRSGSPHRPTRPEPVRRTTFRVEEIAGQDDHAIAGANASTDCPPTVEPRSLPSTDPEVPDDFDDPSEPPKNYRSGILAALLKLHGQQNNSNGGSGNGSNSRTFGKLRVTQISSNDPSAAEHGWQSPPRSPTAAETSAPLGGHWYSHGRTRRFSVASASSTLIGSREPSSAGLADDGSRERRAKKSGIHRRSISANGAIAALNRRLSTRLRTDEEVRITKHIAQTIQRQRYLLRLCKALMLYGAPTHRLEEYMMMTAGVLEIDAQFLYIPGAMIISFDDTDTHTAEVKLVKVIQGLDLSKLSDVHEIYKEVVSRCDQACSSHRRSLKSVLTKASGAR
jgi:hypothetical protein